MPGRSQASCPREAAFPGAFPSTFFFPVADLIALPSASFALSHRLGISIKIQCTALPWKHLHLTPTSFNILRHTPLMESHSQHPSHMFHVGWALKPLTFNYKLTKSCRKGLLVPCSRKLQLWLQWWFPAPLFVEPLWQFFSMCFYIWAGGEPLALTRVKPMVPDLQAKLIIHQKMRKKRDLSLRSCIEWNTQAWDIYTPSYMRRLP